MSATWAIGKMSAHTVNGSETTKRTARTATATGCSTGHRVWISSNTTARSARLRSARAPSGIARISSASVREPPAMTQLTIDATYTSVYTKTANWSAGTRGMTAGTCVETESLRGVELGSSASLPDLDMYFRMYIGSGLGTLGGWKKLRLSFCLFHTQYRAMSGRTASKSGSATCVSC